MTDDDNPYERWDIDPQGGPAEITRRMRALVEDAVDDAQRAVIRAAWEELTLHPARRLRAALDAHPDSHGVSGAAPPPPPRRARGGGALQPRDVFLVPSVVGALGLEDEADDELPDVPLDQDPILRD